MTFEHLMWQIALPIVIGFAVGLCVWPIVKAAISITVTFTVITFCVLVWEAFTRAPTFLESLGVTARPDPIQQTMTLAKAAVKTLGLAIAALPPSSYIGFAAGIVAVLARANARKSREKKDGDA